MYDMGSGFYGDVIIRGCKVTRDNVQKDARLGFVHECFTGTAGQHRVVRRDITLKHKVGLVRFLSSQHRIEVGHMRFYTEKNRST